MFPPAVAWQWLPDGMSSRLPCKGLQVTLLIIRHTQPGVEVCSNWSSIFTALSQTPRPLTYQHDLHPSFHPDDPDRCTQPDAGVLAMGSWQTAHFQGDEVRHGEHVPGDYRQHGKYIGGDDDDDGLMVRMVVTYFDNHSQFHVHALVWRLFCAILTVID